MIFIKFYIYIFIEIIALKIKKDETDEELNNDKNLTNNSSNNAFDDNIRLFQSARSKTMPPSTLDKTVTRKNNKDTFTFTHKPVTQTMNTDRLKMAKEEAERAIKVNLIFYFSINYILSFLIFLNKIKQKKIFTIIGPYPALRESLRNRGWVEKFENMNSLPTLKKKVKDRRKDEKDKDDDKDDDCNNADDNNDDTDEGYLFKYTKFN